MCVFFFSSRRRHTRYWRDWSSDVCSSDLTRWVDLLECDGAKVLLSYDHPQFGRHPAVTTAVHGDGRITTVGTVPDPQLARDLASWLVPDPHPGWGELPASVTVASATTRDGRRLQVVHNWSWQGQRVTPP